ncbi:hypothetical protein E2C01_036825 [Portunus trituberculatus]|uniref:Uncharacterized protein n=1 Tax=Portunus trituberculatus TaxID=210409 RepID=A0A5B7FCF1_PORTR|nr:hypothetical protein [Portunus trituberculatus]
MEGPRDGLGRGGETFSGTRLIIFVASENSGGDTTERFGIRSLLNVVDVRCEEYERKRGRRKRRMKRICEEKKNKDT